MKTQAFSHQAGIYAYCQRVIEAFHPDCIILYGSVARGEDHPQSDVDILVVGGTMPENFFERIYELNRLRLDDTPIEVMGYTLAEWEHMMQRLHLTTLEALEQGVPLYGESLFRQWKKRLEGWKQQGLRRGPDGWSAPKTLMQRAA